MKKFFWGIRKNFFRLLKKCKKYDTINMIGDYNYNLSDSDEVTNVTNIYSAQEKAENIAKYIIYFFNEHGKTITNLQLQKILYFSWIDYYKQTDKELFDDYFFAWRYGPVIPDVYYKYNCYGRSNIPKEDPYSLMQDCDECLLTDDIKLRCDKTVLNSIIESYTDTPATMLVEKSHLQGGAWDQTFENGEGERYLITYSLIKEKLR